MIDASLLELGILAAVGLVAGWINTVAGAGSLLLLPALIFTGLDASQANATNRIGILATTIAAVLGYRRAGLSVGRSELVLTGAAMVGGAIGAFVATLLAPSQMQIAIVVAMAVMLVLSLVPARKKPATPTPDAKAGARGADAESAPAGEAESAPAGEAESAPAGEAESAPAGEAAPEAATSHALPAPTPGMIAAFVAIGIYGGFLQAGLGIVVLLYLSIAHGVSLVASNVVKSTVTLALTVIAIVVFAARGETLDLVRGGVLAVSSAAGGLIGARATVALGDRFVRVVVVIAVVASMIKLLADTF